MITEDAFPFAPTAESHYAKEDKETMKVGGQLVSGRFRQSDLKILFLLLFMVKHSSFTLQKETFN